MTWSLRNGLIETAQAMNAGGISTGTSGNLSVRHRDGMLITPSGLPYAGMETTDIVYVDRNGEPMGERAPSSEWRFHHDIYAKRPEAQAVLHAHPEHCSTLASLRKPIPAFHYMVAIAGGRDIRVAEYATFGTQQLSDNVLAALSGRRACLMANHGLVCFAGNLRKVLSLAIEIEHLARTYIQTLSVGEPTLLDDEEMDRVAGKFRSYGDQSAD